MFIVFPRLRVRVSVFALPAFLLMAWLEGFMPFFIIVLSAVFHEAGHIFMMNYCGYRLRRVDILPMGALIVCPEGIPDRDEVRIALSGPIVSLFLSLISALIFVYTNDALALLAVLMNFVFGFFNLLPIRKLDGGKALFCYLSDKTKKAEQICFFASRISLLLFLAAGTAFVVLSNFNLGVIVLTSVLMIQLLE